VNETEFAYRIRQALDEGAEHIDYKVSLRLEKARQAALARLPATRVAPAWVPALQLANGGSEAALEGPSRLGAWMMRLGLAAPLLALAIGIVSIKQWQNDRLISELADTDLAVLLDDTPIDTYAHQGFGVYLRDEKDM
jgi:hypothetical protein